MNQKFLTVVKKYYVILIQIDNICHNLVNSHIFSNGLFVPRQVPKQVFTRKGVEIHLIKATLNNEQTMHTDW